MIIQSKGCRSNNHNKQGLFRDSVETVLVPLKLYDHTQQGHPAFGGTRSNHHDWQGFYKYLVGTAGHCGRTHEGYLWRN